MKPVVGQKGVKYGLQTRRPPGAKQPAPPGRLAAFAADSDSDEETVGAQVARQAARKVADSKVQEMYAAALAEDPTAFDYDGVYDSMQEAKAAPKQRDKALRQPKYIASLLEQAELRKREEGITYERRLLKERQKEDHMYDTTEQFITSAYRRKLEEDKRWQESQRLRELDEERNDVTKLGNMNNFFANLGKNVALGSSTEQQRRAAAAAAAQQQQPERPQSTSASPEPEAARDPERQQPPRRSPEPQPSPPREQREQHGPPEPATSPSRQAARGSPPREAEPQQPQQQQQPAQPIGGKRKNDDGAVAAARERYLARKRQQGGG